MKKQLLLGTALLAATGILAQSKRSALSPDLVGAVAAKYAPHAEQPVQYTVPKKPAGPQNASAQKTSSGPLNWNRITNSYNVFGVLLPESKSVSYDEDLDAVCLIVRTGPGYVASPAPQQTGSQTGVILAFITHDWGTTWDSTAVWNNEDDWARYPQGGIWNPHSPTTNTLLSNAYAVATGPVTKVSTNWEGNWLASKKLDVFTNTVSSTPGATLFAGSIGSNIDTAIKKVDFLRQDFQATDDGKVRVLGPIYDNPMSTTQPGYRGSRIVTGVFSNGAFVWHGDSISLANSPVDYDAPTLDYFNTYTALSDMAWSEDGQIGYCWFIGCNTNNTLHNKGFQPIVWMTTNGGTSWSLIPSINFNDTIKFAPVLNRVKRVEIAQTGQKHLRIPHFNPRETIAGVVDKNGNLHLASDVLSTRFAGNDSLSGVWSFPLATQVYFHDYANNQNPMIYDFTFKRSTSDWNVIIVDSMRTEAPNAGAGTTPATNGYTYNPWNISQNAKQSCDNRLQMSRTPDGKYIVYTWAESNPLFTSNGVRWNILPNLYARMRNVDSMSVYPDRIALTENSPDPDLLIRGKAYMHTASTKMKLATGGNPGSLTFSVPIRFTNSDPLNADLPNNHWYTNGAMTFTTAYTATDVAVPQYAPLIAQNVALYPNPAKDNVQMGMNVHNNMDVQVSIINIVGQEVRRQSLKATEGLNNYSLDVNGLTTGIYMVNVKAGSATVTKKLIIE